MCVLLSMVYNFLVEQKEEDFEQSQVVAEPQQFVAAQAHTQLHPQPQELPTNQYQVRGSVHDSVRVDAVLVPVVLHILMLWR